jgi:signal transduction histidine kinase/CheY-like chemotaxis protein/HPt (histidine-containing phosphotransfer) domain-containing protein
MTTPAATRSADVDAQLLRIAYDRLPASLGMTVAVVAIFLTVLWPVLTPWQHIGWASAVLGSVLLRHVLCWQFKRRATPAAPSARWGQLFTLGAALGGAAWSTIPGVVMLERAEAGPLLAVFVGVLLSVCAVAVHTMAAQRSAGTVFVLAALLPIALVGLGHGGNAQRVTGLVVLAGMVALVVVGRRSAASLRQLLLAQAELRAALADADTARAHAVAGSVAKTRFLANMSHELRTPLNTVIGAAQLLRVHRSEPQQLDTLTDAIQRSGANLLGLIENILDLAHIESGELAIRDDEFHLVECIEAALATAALAATAKGLRLACIVAPALPAWRRGDAARLRQIVLNLLGNAVKFTATGEVVVRVDDGALPGTVCVRISDTGVGIPAASLARIFEPFRQADDGADRRFGGSGLGLAIVHQLVAAMGGDVSVTSTPGQGSCFAVTLPLPPAADAPAEPPPLRHRMALIEPHPASAAAAQAHLLRLGCEVVQPDSMASLRHWLASPGPAPWLLVAAEASDGLEAVLDLIEPHRLLVMADQVRDDADRAREAQHLARQMPRPVTRALLVSRLLRQPQAALQAAPPRPVLPSISDLAAMPHVLLVEDDALNRTIIGGMLAHAGHRVSTAVDGEAALARLHDAHDIDLVLMDWQMPGMDGLEVTRRLRDGAAGAPGRTLPIIGLTANAFAEDRERCLAAGMNDFLTKPVLAERLLRTVARWLPPRTALPAAGSAGSAPHATTDRGDLPPAFDPAVLAALPMVADGSAPEVANELLAMYLDSGPAQLAAVAQAAAAGDARTLLRLLHTLKSGSASVGALQLAALAGQQEAVLREGGAPDSAWPAQLDHAWQAMAAATGHHPTLAHDGPRP